MKKRTITNQTIKSFERHLIENEKAEATSQGLEELSRVQLRSKDVTGPV